MPGSRSPAPHRLRLWALLILVALMAAACSSDDAETGGGEEPAVSTTTVGGGGLRTISSDVERADPSAVPVADIETVARADAELGLRLLRLAGAEGGNTFLSPYSIATALAMLLPGAKGATEAEIAQVLGAAGVASYHPARGALEATVTTPAEVAEDQGDPLVLRAANQLFGQEGYAFLDDYVDTLGRFYGAPLVAVDYATDPEGSRRLVNGWVADQTEDRIDELIPQGVIDTLTRLVLVNAVYFKAGWAEPFDPENTADQTFTDLDGTSGPVPMMSELIGASYGTGGDYEAVRLAYADRTTSMLVIVPDDGAFTDFVAGLDGERLAEIKASLDRYSVDLDLPSFEFRTSIGLKPLLRDLGMEAAFDPATADLSGITGTRELFVQDALHDAFVAVDEEGTEAAAATAVIVGFTAAPPSVEVTVDRPFIFVIEHEQTGEMLFVGQVTELAGPAE